MNVSCDNSEYIIVDNEIIVGPVYLSTECSITFTPSYQIRGYVVNNNDEAVTNATVEVHSNVRSAVTDSTGYFELTNVVTGSHELKVLQSENTVHDSNFSIRKNSSFNIAGNTITGASTTSPIKIKIKLNSNTTKTFIEDTTHRVTVNSANATPSTTLDIVENGSNSETTITPNTGYEYTNVVCNNATGTYENGTLVVENVIEDTICTVGFGGTAYNVSLVSNTEEGTIMYPVTYGVAYGTFPTLSKTYYTFDGWYKEGTYENVVTSETIVNTASNHSLYGKWNANEYEVTYNCVANGGTCTIPNAPVAYGSNIDLTKTASKEGYTFIGWNTDSDATIGLSSIVMNTAGKTIYAIYQKTITATYNSNGSTLSKVSDSCTIYNNTTSCTFTSPTITRANYTIIGFNTNSTATTSTLNVETIYEISNDTTYYAITRDAKQPSISLGSNSETTYTKSKSVIVTVSDGESGLATSQGIKYGWSTSNTTAPSSYTNVVLSNTNAASSTTFTASSTDTLTGQYYLWIVPNTSVCDVIGNCNTTTVKSTGLFYFDNTSPSCSISASSSDDTINMSIASTDAQSGLATSNGYGYKYGSQSSYTMSSNSTYSFSGLQSGTYTVYGYVVDKLGNYNTCSTSVTVTLAITYARLSASYSCANASAGSSPYIMSYTGNCSIISDGGTNWRVKLLSGGNLSFSSNFSIDLFLVGGGGGAGSNVTHGGGGGAGGKTLTVKKVAVTSASSPYTIVIGSGGAARTTGGTSSGFTYSIAGGGGGTNGSSSVGGSGGTGGSGGGGGGHNGSGGYGGAGGSYGNSGSDGGRENGVAGSGQGSTTCEFGEGTTSACTNGTNYLYSAGGGGGGGYHTSGFLSSGSNGAGLSGSNSGAGGQAPNGTGSSGIVIIRNAR